MLHTYAVVPESIGEFDPYSNATITPTYAPLPELRGGVQVFGMHARAMGQQLAIPGFVENLVSIQLQQRLHVHVQMDRSHRTQLSPGDIAVVPQGTPVHAQAISGEMNALLLALPPRLLQETMARDVEGNPDRIELRPQIGQQDPLLHSIALAMHDQFRTRGAADSLYLDALIGLLAVHLLRTYTVFEPRTPRTVVALPANILRRIFDYIESNLDQDLSLETLGAVAQYSPYHLARMFKESTGHTLHQYVIARRLNKAIELMEQTDHSLQEIAEQVGFGDQSHFARHFKRRFGCAPGAVRGRHRVM